MEWKVTEKELPEQGVPVIIDDALHAYPVMAHYRPSDEGWRVHTGIFEGGIISSEWVVRWCHLPEK